MASVAQHLHPGQWLTQWRAKRGLGESKASADMPLPTWIQSRTGTALADAEELRPQIGRAHV